MPKQIVSAEERLRQLEKAKLAAKRERLLRQSAEPIYRKYRTVVPSLFCTNGELRVHRVIAGKEEVLETLKLPAIFTLDTASELRWGMRLMHVNNICAYLNDDAPLGALAEKGYIESKPIDTYLFAPPFPTGCRLFSVLTPSPPPHETLANGYIVVRRSELVREYIGLFGLRLDLLAVLDEKLEDETR